MTCGVKPDGAALVFGRIAQEMAIVDSSSAALHRNSAARFGSIVRKCHLRNQNLGVSVGIDGAAVLPRAAPVNQRKVFEDGLPANNFKYAKAIVAVDRVTFAVNRDLAGDRRQRRIQNNTLSQSYRVGALASRACSRRRIGVRGDD